LRFRGGFVIVMRLSSAPIRWTSSRVWSRGAGSPPAVPGKSPRTPYIWLYTCLGTVLGALRGRFTVWCFVTIPTGLIPARTVFLKPPDRFGLVLAG